MIEDFYNNLLKKLDELEQKILIDTEIDIEKDSNKSSCSYPAQIIKGVKRIDRGGNVIIFSPIEQVLYYYCADKLFHNVSWILYSDLQRKLLYFMVIRPGYFGNQYKKYLNYDSVEIFCLKMSLAGFFKIKKHKRGFYRYVIPTKVFTSVVKQCK